MTTDHPHPESSRFLRPKLGFHTDQAERIRAAYLGTRPHLPASTFGEFLEAAVLEKIERLEVEYNNGQPWGTPADGDIKSASQIGVGRWKRD
ncbi:ParB family protein [Rhodococcus artemisiae]|uniref:Centromere-binding protein ParB C-terminal domain-containing protein n=1 Tax=Rhodococcus artemisiae TaxID=714159 RepID=A0ABU7LJP0_9NOCA|nr:hypothetical protein [Rhodococcus artemisiae]MEE2061770.1 hypothetical protein [Rhodococcus artemisiae]